MNFQSGCVRSGSINLVGDLMFRSRLAPSMFTTGAFHEVLSELGSGDVAIANLEMPLSRRGTPVPKWANLRSDPTMIDDVRRMGIAAVSLANNHMMDYDREALLDTLAACDSGSIARCGAGRDLDEALRPVRLIAGGLRVALIGVSCTVPLESEARPGKPGIAPLHIGLSFELEINQQAEQPGTMPPVHTWAEPADLERVSTEIASARSEADLVIVAIHWGVPTFWLSPRLGILAEYQTPLGHALIDAGADVIYGHHSHSLHPIEIYRGKPIFYSLGNFLFDWVLEFMEPESVIVRLTVGSELSVELVPLMIDDAGFPRLATGAAGARVLEKLEQISQPYGTQLIVQGGRATVALDTQRVIR
jgi:poly-gamma-glutamate capsule biosynthesis protein CapA/YwtB (metallophosphatase superfamily)